MLQATPQFRFYHPASATSRPQAGISACLAGERVRYDGSDRQLDTLEQVREQLRLVTVCPEDLAGLGTPRPPVQLVMSEHGLRALGRDDPALDATPALLQQRSSYLREIRHQPLCGFILKSRSPSCALHSAPVFIEGRETYYDNGIFTDGLLHLYPWLALCEDRDLGDPSGLQHFVWQCRLVEDILFRASEIPLDEVHRHYAAQFSGQTDFPEDYLQRHVSEQDRGGYVSELLEAIRGS